MLPGELVMRHLWCCVAHTFPPASCEGMPMAVDARRVAPALQSMPAQLRHDVYTYARMGPESKRPYTGLCCLAKKRGMRPKELRERAQVGAAMLERALCG